MSVSDFPNEYIEYYLCKTFHCLPSQLEKEDDYKLNIFLTIMNFENEKEKKDIDKMKRKNQV